MASVMDEQSRMSKVSVVMLKVVLTIVAYAIVAGLAGKMSQSLTGRTYSGGSIADALAVSVLVPIWYGAPLAWRFAAASAGVAAGLGTWMISLAIQSPDPIFASKMIGFIRAGAILVSLVVCVSILREGRARRTRELTRSTLA